MKKTVEIIWTYKIEYDRPENLEQVIAQLKDRPISEIVSGEYICKRVGKGVAKR